MEDPWLARSRGITVPSDLSVTQTKATSVYSSLLGIEINAASPDGSGEKLLAIDAHTDRSTCSG